MIAFGFGPWELGIVALVVLLLFGNRLPGAAKSLGQSFSAFKKGIKEGSEDENLEGPENGDVRS
ncbi:MAG: twin-arginine translocase TatA/TatE family subunit [Fuerstiella sp.]